MSAYSSGPIQREPRRLRPPHDGPDLMREQRFGDETTDQWRARIHADNLAALTEQLDGIQLGVYDRRILDWLAGWGVPTIAVVVSLLGWARWAGLEGGRS